MSVLFAWPRRRMPLLAILFGVFVAGSGIDAHAEAVLTGDELQKEIVAMAEDFAQSKSYHDAFQKDVAGLDFSIESLAILDAELDILRAELPDGDEGKDLGTVPDYALQGVVLSFGTYAGEVIRRNSEQPYRWIGFEEMPDDARIAAGDEKSLGNVLVLTVGDTGSVTFPLGKVMKYLQNGPEDSLKFYAQVMVKQSGEASQ